jgi:FixJ family two-component response regulator
MADFQMTDEDVQEFLVEATELLDVAEEKLMKIDQGEEFPKNYDAIFRAFHSIKGASGMLGWNKLQNHMHQVETHFQNAKSLPTLNPAQTSYFLGAIDACRDLLDGKDIQFEYKMPSQSDATPATTQARVIQMTQQQGEKIFVIDDEPDLVEVLSDFIKDAGHTPIGFTNPEEAVAALKKEKPDVVFTDMKMPKMSGADVLKAVGTYDPDVPVIFVSGHLNKEMVIDAISHGIFGVVEKPFKDSQIIGLANAAVRRSQTMKLLNRSINFIMYQFSDLDEFLVEKGKHELRAMMKADLANILEARRKLKGLKKAA